jgi:HD-like signal output (HDOD) protein
MCGISNFYMTTAFMTTEIDLEQAKAMVKGIDIPVRPVILQKVMDLQSNPDVEIKEMANVISSDVTLSACVLKTINSPLYGLRNNISSIHRAVNLLGMSNVLNLVIGVSLRLELSGNLNVAVERFWDSANRVALLSARLARAFDNTMAEEAYTLGLFHDCGIPLLIMKFPDYVEVLKAANQDHGRLFTDVEDDAHQTNHTVVGYYVANSWHIPKRICMGILSHHAIDLLDSEDRKQNDLIANLKLAEAIGHRARKLTDSAEWIKIQDEILDYLSLGVQEYEDLRDDLLEELSQAA